jgi:N-acetylglucosaminyldiphosphoundecaprenol N-acetyl-beta-D-mannosaminyltransferase
MSNVILGISVPAYSNKQIFECIYNYIKDKKFLFVSSLNPEILVQAYHNPQFREILNTSNIKLTDGVGITIAGKILNVPVGERLPGVELMESLIKYADHQSLKVLIIGGSGTVSEQLATSLQKDYPHAEFKGTYGYKNMNDAHPQEELEVNQLIGRFKPDMVFVAFGAPKQEKWIFDHKEQLQNSVAICVGGAVDFISGNVPRAPEIIQNIGMEWLFRLIVQPWRWKRQLRLIEFMWLVLKQRFSNV